MITTRTISKRAITPQVLHGRIEAVRLNGAITPQSSIEATGALAANITYDVKYVDPDGDSLTAEDYTPSNQRPSITHRIIPAAEGKACLIFRLGSHIEIHVTEGVFVGSCEP